MYINICICVSLHACMLRMYVIFCQYMYYVCKYKKMSAVYSSTRWSIYPPVRLHTYTFIYMPIYLSLYTIYPFVWSVRLIYVCMCVMSCQMYEWLSGDCSKILFPTAGGLNFFYGQLQKPKNF